jgi:protein TonB
MSAPECFQAKWEPVRVKKTRQNMALALYELPPPRHDVRRWSLASLVMVALHAGLFAAFAGWRPDATPMGSTMPAILVDLSPASASLETQQLDLAPGPPMQQADAPAQQPDKLQPVEETIAPTPPQPNPIVAMPPEQKPTPQPVKPSPVRDVAKKHSDKPPAPKTTAAPRAERQAPAQNAAAAGAAAAAATASYDALIVAHLLRFKQYPEASRAAGEQGTALLSFAVSRTGQVLSRHIGRSSGHPALDADTLALLRRAEPLPAFPPEMRQASKNFSVPIAYMLR